MAVSVLGCSKTSSSLSEIGSLVGLQFTEWRIAIIETDSGILNQGPVGVEIRNERP